MNNTGARMSDSMYHMTLKHLKSHACRYFVKVFPVLRKVITLENHQLEQRSHHMVVEVYECTK